MINIEYANAYSEVLQILKYIPKSDYNKIPENKIELFKVNSNKEYKFYYNPNKTLNEQNVSKRTKAIIAILYRDYWATPEIRKEIIARQKYDMLLREKAKGKYNPNDLFKNKSNIQSEQKNISVDNVGLTKYKETLLSKIIIKIRNFLNIK